MNVKTLLTMDYDDFAALRLRKNKPNSKPISGFPSRASRGGRFGLSLAKQSQFPKGQMNAKFFVTKDYEKEPRLWARKTNPNKANFEPIPMPAPASAFGPTSKEFDWTGRQVCG